MTKWTDERVYLLLELISSAISSGKAQPNGNLKTKDGWKPIQAAMEDKFGSDIFDVQCLKNKLQSLKKNYRSYSKVVGLSGAGSGTDARLDEAAWNELIVAHPDCGQWKDNEFIFYEPMNQVFRGTFATGTNALSVKDLAENGVPSVKDEPTYQKNKRSFPQPKKQDTLIDVLTTLTQSFQNVADSFSARGQASDHLTLAIDAVQNCGIEGDDLIKALEIVSQPEVTPMFVRLAPNVQKHFLNTKGVKF